MGSCDGSNCKPIYDANGEELPSPLQFNCDCAYSSIQEFGDCGVEYNDVSQTEYMILTLGDWEFQGDDCQTVLDAAIDHVQDIFLALWKAKFTVQKNQKNYGRDYSRKPWRPDE